MGDPPIGTYPPPWYAVLCHKHICLELGAIFQGDIPEIKLDGLTF